MKPLDLEQKMVFGVAPDEFGGAPIVILGIPAGAWEYMKDGKTHHFDLSPVGLPVKLLMYGGKNHAEVMKPLEQSVKNAGGLLAANKALEEYPIKELPGRPEIIKALMDSAGMNLTEAKQAADVLIHKGFLKVLP